MKWTRIEAGEYASDSGWRIRHRQMAVAPWTFRWRWTVYPPGDASEEGDASFRLLREAKDFAEDKECRGSTPPSN